MKIAVCVAPGRRDALAISRRMAEAQCLAPHHVYTSLHVGPAAVSYVDSAANPRAPLLFQSNDEGDLVVATGVPLGRRGSVGDVLRRSLDGDFYAGLRQLSELDGAHATFLWDQASETIGVVTDLLGMQPLYMSKGGGYVLFATERRAFHASGLLDPEPDPAGWGAFCSFGHMIGPATMLRRVERAPPASLLVTDPHTATVSVERYWSWPVPGPSRPLSEVDTSALLEPLRRDASRYLEYGAESTMLLSGGFDSRLLLALALEAGARPSALALRHANEAGGADGRFARALGRRFDLDLVIEDSPPDFYQSADYLRYVRRNECATPSLYLFIAQVARHVGPGHRAVWEGVFPGAVFRPPATLASDRRVLGLAMSEGLWQGADIVLDASFVGEMRTSFQRLLASERSLCSGGGGFREFFIRNRTRNRTAPNPLLVYANEVVPLTPGLNRDLLSTDISIRTERESKDEVLLTLLRVGYPELLRVPVISGGHLVPRGAWDARYLLEKAGAVSVSALRRLRARWGRLPARSEHAWATTGMVDRVLERARPDDPFINADGLRRVRCADEFSGALRRARHLLFYWQMWRWIMNGELTDGLIRELAGQT